MKGVRRASCLLSLMIALVFLEQSQTSAAEKMDETTLSSTEIEQTLEKEEKNGEKTSQIKAPIDLGEMVVTTTRTERAVDLTPKPVSVIDKETIETRNPATILELLDEIPGISFSRAGPLGGQVNLRGFNSNDSRSPLFIDGDRFRGRNTFEYIALDPSRIERIEVIRGPAASMYGTDSMAGLINVITRKAEGDIDGPFTLSPRLRSLSYSSASNLRKGSLEVQGVGNGFDMLIGLSGSKSDDYESPDGEIANSDMESWSTDLKLGYTLAQDHRIELSAKYMEVEQGQAGGIYAVPGYPYNVRRQEPFKEKMAKIHYQGERTLGLEHIEASLYARDLYTHMIVKKRPKDDPASSLTKADVYVDGPLITGGKLFGVQSWGATNSLTIGTDFFYEDRDASEQEVAKYDADGNLTSYSARKKSGIDSSQLNVGLFVHDDWDPSEKWTISASGRLDYFRSEAKDDVPNYTGSTESSDYPVTGSAGVIYRPIPILHFTANSSTTYRAPTSTEKFEMSSGFEPNPDLDPEKGMTHEVGIRLRLPIVTANLTGFWSEYEDLIVRKTVDSTIYAGTTATQRQNVGEARIKGLELDASWVANENWKAFMNAAYLHGTDTKTDTPLPYIAPLNGLVGVRYTPDSKDFYIEATNKWSAEKDRIDDTQERETDAYFIWNLYMGFDIRKLSSRLPDMELRMAVENILDEKYRNPTTTEDISYDRSDTNPLLEPGRCVSVSLTSRF